MKIRTVIILYFFALLLPSYVYAHDYVLPYPSFMPGNKLYKISRFIDRIENFWYWGSLAQTKYHMGLADKYLVESKVLFEYKQYLLGVDALKRSDLEFQKIRRNIANAQIEKKDVSKIVDDFSAQEEKHEEVLSTIEEQTPGSILWSPEKDSPTNIQLHGLIDASIKIRKTEIEGI